VPTLYLHGRTDGCMGVDVVASAGSALTAPGSRVELVDDAGHFLHLERPDTVDTLVLDFLAEG
jgi:pimeloyl-ACP methyl ester carboxylesterase